MAAALQTLANIYTYVRSLANKDSNTLTDATLLSLANIWYYKIIRELADINEDIFGEISTASLVANQTEYVLPIDDTASTYGGGTIKILRIEKSYDGSLWKVAHPIDITNREDPTIYDSSVGPTVAEVNNNYSTSFPKYGFFDRSIWIYPIPTS